MERNKAISDLVEKIISIKLNHPVRVGIDGVDASGKTRLAEELVEPLQAKGRSVIRISIDGFHNTKEIRYSKGRNSPIGYYEDSFNIEAIIRNVLEPLGPEGSLSYKQAIFDFKTNSIIGAPFESALKDSILVFEGVFLHHPLLVSHWDFSIFVHADFKITLERAQARDLYLFGDQQKIKGVYLNRYIPGQKIYLESENPLKKADAVLVNNECMNPELIFK